MKGPIHKNKHLNQVLRAIRNVNQLITQEKDRDKLLKGVCEAITGDRGYNNAWIALLDEEQKATAAFESGLGADCDTLFAQLSRGELSHCTKGALGQQGVIVLEDPAAECGDCPLSQQYAGRGGLSVRLEHEGEVYGLLTTSIPKEFLQDDEEHSLLKEAANDIAFALHSLHVDAERKRAEEALRTSEEKLRVLFEEHSDLITLVDSQAKPILANPAWKRVFGEDFGAQQDAFDQIHPDDIAQVAQAWEGLLGRGQRIRNLQYRFKLEDGSYRTYATSAFPVTVDGAPCNYTVAPDVTERAQSEKLLVESQQRLAAAEAIAHLGTVDWNPITNEVEWSDEEFRIRGHRPNEFQPTMALTLAAVHPDDLAMVERIIREALRVENGGEHGFDHRLVQPGGEIKWVHATNAVTRDKEGSPVRVLGTNVDITERKHAEQALRDSEAKYRRVSDNSPAILYQFKMTPDGAMSFPCVSDSVSAIMGITPEDVMRDPSTLLGMVHPEDQEIFRESIMESAESLETLPVTFRCMKDGKVLWIEARGTPTALTDGGMLWDGFLLDITERKQADEALQASEAFNRSIVENSPDCIKTLDLDGNLLTMSTGGQALLEIDDLQSYLGKSWIEFWKKEDQERVRHAVHDAGQGNIGRFEAFCPTEKGTPKWWDVVLSPIRQSPNVIDHVLAVSRDITEHKQLEEQLLQAQKMESVGRLAGGVAHDFNNLLTVILSSCAFMADDLREGDPLLEDLREIRDAGDRAVALTRQLLAFSRRQMLQTEVISLNETIENLDKMLRRLIGEDVDVTNKLDPCLWNVEADPGQIEQIVVNLAVNARDAMPGGGKLIIETANIELDEEYARNHVSVTPGPYVMLAVSDTGAGMDKETAAQVFDPFFSTKEKDKGTGLGLSTVYGIVKQHGGNIWVYSESGMGTTFKIYLPRATKTEKTTSSTPGPIADTRGAETVLVVEDEAALLKLAVRVLERKGYKVLAARDGLEGQSVANEHDGPIHLLLTDVVMPHTGGKELAEKLAVTRPELKVIYMSGYTDDAIVYHGVLDESTHFIQKPFGIDALAQKVREVLSKD